MQSHVDAFAIAWLVTAVVQGIKIRLLGQHKALGFHHLSNQFRLVTIFFFIAIVMVLPHIRDVFQKQHGENEVFVGVGTDGATEYIACSPQRFVDGVLVNLIGHLVLFLKQLLKDALHHLFTVLKQFLGQDLFLFPQSV